MRHFKTYLFVGALFLLFSNCKKAEIQILDYQDDICEKLYSSTINLSDELRQVIDTSGQKTGVYIFEEGEEAVISRAWLSQHALKKIDIQYFIYSSDNIGIIATDYLIRAADRGVKVRLIVDDLMIDAKEDYILALDQHQNIEIKIYNPNLTVGKNLGQKIKNTFRDFRGINQRMHNKTFIVDGEIVITGGRNIADEYFDYDHEYNFRDRDILLIGGASSEVQVSFEEFWSHELSMDIEDIVDASLELDAEKIYDWIHAYACDSRNFWPEIRERIRDIPQTFRDIMSNDKLIWLDHVEFFSDAPGKNETKNGLGGGGASTDKLIDLVNQSKREIYIHSPYLVVTDLGLSLFEGAIERGVHVHILTNSLSSTDNLEAFSGYQRSRNALLEIGVSIYEFRPDAAIRKRLLQSDLQEQLAYIPTFGLHSKSMVIDDDITVVGTFNLDPRSANLNTECIVIAHSTDLNTMAKSIMIEELKPENAWHTTSAFNPDKEASMGKRFKAYLRRVVPKSIL